MTHLTSQHLKDLLGPSSPPCLSVYQPTHRHFPDNQRDPLTFKNLLKATEASLSERYPTNEVQSLTAPLRKLADDVQFWNHTLDGLAVLADRSRFEVFRVHRTLPELAIVADTFHIKPLLRYLQSADHFHLLCLTRTQAWLLEGNRYALDPVDGEGFSATIEEMLGADRTEPHLSVRASAGAGSAPIGHGHGSRKDERKLDTERFFRAVDRRVLDEFSQPTGYPLLLAALTEHHALFRHVSRNGQLVPEGVEGDPEALSIDRLRERAWRLLEPLYRQRLARLKDRFHAAHAQHAASADLSDAARAVLAGRVDTLLVDDQRTIPGRIDLLSGAVQPGQVPDPEVGDMLDDLAELALRYGGDVVAVPGDQMPTSSGLAAIYRY